MRFEKIRTSFGTVVGPFWPDVVRRGLEEGWLTPDDKVVEPNGERTLREVCWYQENLAALVHPLRAHGIVGLELGAALAIWIVGGPALWNQLVHAAVLRHSEGLSAQQPSFFILLCCLMWLTLPLLVWGDGLGWSLDVPILGALLGAFFIFAATGLGPLDLFAYPVCWEVVGSVLMGGFVGWFLGVRMAPSPRLSPSSPIPADIPRIGEPADELLHDSDLMPDPPGYSSQSAIRRVGAPVFVTLVHGTFADSRWAAGLRQSIGECMRSSQVKFEDFTWNGRNSHGARLGAADKLHEDLRSRLKLPGRHFIIAHSHGGTVVSYALRKLSARERGVIDGVVYLATPFLVAKPRRMEKSHAKVATITKILGFSAVLWVFDGLDFLRLVGQLVEFSPFREDSGLGSNIFPFLAGMFGIIAILLGVFFAGLTIKEIVESRRTLNPISPIAERLDSSRQEKVPILCIYDDRDEARRWLRFLNRLAVFPAKILENLPVKRIFFAAVVALVLGGYAWHLWPDILSYEKDEGDINSVPAAVRGTALLGRLIWGYVPTRVFGNITTAAASAGLICAAISAGLGLSILLLFAFAQKLLVGSPLCVGSVSFSDFSTSSRLCIRVLRRPRNSRGIGCEVHKLKLRKHGSFMSLYHCAVHHDPVALNKINSWISEGTRS